jgi:hypothetical protein
MKKFLNKFLVIAVASAVLGSCKKDETKAVLSAGTPASGLTATPSTVVLTKATENNKATTFTFSAANFGFNAAITYTLQFAKPGNNFVTLGTIELPGNSTSQDVTVRTLNIAALNAGIDTNTSQPLEVRLKADIGHGSAPVYSAKITMNIKGYSLNSYLYIPGDYQGWAPATAPQVVSINSTGLYEGYVNLTASGYQGFKFTNAPDWGHGIYGDAAGSGTSGNLASPGNDIKFTNPGFYRLTVNLNSNTYTMTKTTWSVIGDGAAGWSTDVPMTYDAANKVWKVTTTLNAAGQIKFRANNDWALNFGGNGTASGLKYDGSNLSVPGGSHTVILNLSVPGAYTYQIQ